MFDHHTDGSFKRQDSQFRSFVTKDGSSGFRAEPNRYHLYISLACPWASRCLAMRHVKGLTNVIGLSVTLPVWEVTDASTKATGWVFPSEPRDGATPDSVNQCHSIRELYLKANPKYSGRFTVPVLWDKQKSTIVNNESSEIIRMFNSEFEEFAEAKPSVDYYPKPLQASINEVNTWVYDQINNGVYKAGFATKQAAYETACRALFEALDRVEHILSRSRYLCGDQITEADIRLFVTLIRFDAVYVLHFKCNIRRLTEYPNISEYVRDVYQYRGLGEASVNLFHIRQHYYRSHPHINPHGIVPLGPVLPDFTAPHQRDKMKA